MVFDLATVNKFTNKKMQRFTISLDDQLAINFDEFISVKGYLNRSEAVRDLLRERLGKNQLQAKTGHLCVATASYVYDIFDHTVSSRILTLQHDHHDLVISNMRSQLDHSDCLETILLKGKTIAVIEFSEQLIASRGVRHGNIHVVPVVTSSESHSHSHSPESNHKHLKTA